MRIAILGTRGIPAQYGGFETFAEYLSLALAADGHEVTVFCEGEEVGSNKKWKGIKLQFVKEFNLGSLSALVYDLVCLWKARKGFDLVYMLGYGAGIACFVPRIWGAKVWINMDGIEWARSKWSFAARLWFHLMEQMSMWTPNAIVADAEAVKNNLLARYSKMPLCYVIPYGAEIPEDSPDTETLSEWGIMPLGYWLVVCRLEPENNVMEIVKGILDSSSEVPLIIVGNSGLETEYVRKLRRYETDKVRFIGTVFNKEKLTALRYFSLGYLHGHSVGGTNPSLLEAMACSNLVLAHDNPFNREVAGDCALYFSGHEDIARIIDDIDLNKDKYKGMRASACERVRNKYSWKNICNSYLNLIDNL